MYKWFKLQQTTCNIRSSSGLCSGTYIITHPTLFDGSMTLYADDIMIFRPFQTPEDLAILQSELIASHLGHKKKFLQFNADKCKYMVISRKRQTNLSL